MGTALLAFITAIALAGVAAWFSITGLMAIFAALAIPIAIMAGVLEVAKLVTASIVYRNWDTLPRLIKSYLSAAVVILMLITSLGIFGYLSKAHIDQGAPVGDNFAKIERLEQRIAREQRSIQDAETVITELDGVISTLIEYDKISGPDGARAVREGQAEDRDGLRVIIDKSQDNIDEYLDEKAEYATEIRSFETEIGPIKYIAALAYDTPEDHYEEAVRYIILLLIFVFDPLAVLLLIAANHIQMQLKPKLVIEPGSEIEELFDVEDPIVVDEKTYDSLVEAIEDEDREVSPRLRELLNTTPVWEGQEEVDLTTFSQSVEDLLHVDSEIPLVDEFMKQDDEASLQDFVDDFQNEEGVDDELVKRGYTTFAELSIQSDDILNEVVSSLNTKERARPLTPTEVKWRNTCLNILHRRSHNNPLYDVRDNDKS